MNRLPRALLQFAPLSLFAIYAFWYGEPTPDRWVEAFELGAVAALVQLAIVLPQPRPANRLILGANVYLVIAGAAAFAQQWWVLRIYDVLREAGILLAILGVGVVTTLVTKAGFVAAPDAPADEVRHASLWMLAATVLALATAVAFRGDRTLAAALPILGLTILQRTLVSRARRA
jgi:hypothetical protein